MADNTVYTQVGLFDDPEKEDWRVISGFDGVYQVSNKGHVRRAVPGKGVSAGTLVSQHDTDRGSKYVMLYDGKLGMQHNISVHRLVVESFRGEIPSGYDVHHIDGDSANNALNNLRIISKAEHIEMSKNSVPKGEIHYNAKLTADDVREIRRVYKPHDARYGRRKQTSPTLKQLAQKYGVGYQHIAAIVHRKTWRHVKERESRYG